MKNRVSVLLCASVLLIVLAGCSHSTTTETLKISARQAGADHLAPTEGMWLPNALPVDRLEALGYRPTQGWADHLRLATVDLGATGSFVSSDGLILTNHHVALDGLHNISTKDHDYVTNGFLAATRGDEVKLPGREAKVLVSIEDVTARVNAAVEKTLSPADAVKARHAVFATLERESLEKTGYQSEVVTLYGGALYQLYRYKRYTDVRIVFAPELQAAFFGGDPDNFEYPRYCLDIALLRVYENDQPAHVEHYLKLSSQGVRDGELVFVSGHPGRTDRLLPASVLRGMRDRSLPLTVERIASIERAVLEYAARSDEARREAQDELFGVQNWRKATVPRLAALRGGLVEEKQKSEDELRASLRARKDLQHFDQAWSNVEAAEQARAALELRTGMLEWGWALDSQLFSNARSIVRMSAEDAKPDADRLPEFTQSKRPQLEHDLLADYPFYPEMDIANLTASLQFFRDKLGASDPAVKQVLGGKDPAERAAELVHGTKLGGAAERKRLYEGGASAIASSDDAMIILAREMDAPSRALRLEFESKVDEPVTRALTDINRARFELFGGGDYPDATGTLRLSFGLVKGYEQDGQSIPPWTTFAGAFEHEKAHGAKYPYVLPPTWTKAATSLALRTPLDFVSTADITGGNSGSPVVSRSGEQVGIIFDSNRQGVANNFAYTDQQARAVAVDSRGILEALRAIYHADRVLNEMTGK